MKSKWKEFFDVFHSLAMSWQIYTLLIIYLSIMVVAFIFKVQIGWLLLFFLLLLLIFGVFNYKNFLKETNILANELSKKTKMIQNDALFQSPLAILIYDNNYRVKWANPGFQKMVGNKTVLGQELSEIVEELNVLKSIKDDHQWHICSFQNKYYKVMHKAEDQSFYFLDIDIEYRLNEQRKHDRLVLGYIYLDDYDELVQTMTDQEEAQFKTELLKDFTKWSNRDNFYLKRLDDDQYIMIANLAMLEKMEHEKFKHLEEIRQKEFIKHVPTSISLAISYSQAETYDFNQIANQAQKNLELAFGRGGNQTVIRSLEGKARFYGGQNHQSDKRSIVRSKLVFQALLHSIQQADQVYIVGHKRPDLDSIASALGLFRLISSYKKSVRIILNQDTLNHNVQHLLSDASIQKDWAQIFITPEAVTEKVTDQSLIIMVDHHRPLLSEAKDLVCHHDVVIIDHHRRSEDFPEHSVLTFIEPSASSTSELITEFFIYMRNNRKTLSKFDATALLAGIIVDTNNFAQRTSSRTFDAASYLKSKGADMVQIQRFLKEDIASIKQRNRLIDQVSFPFTGIAIVEADDQEIYSTVMAAQSADELLKLKDIEASFVVYRRDKDTVAVSARSLGDINVQTIMEKLNGGGHLSNAATQIKQTSTQKVAQQLKEEIINMLEESK
ncbi:DHH family phosphoesterase [Vaginisenegalia massiliensis]|uniref:DHH family phosphoesterase n=1 Tax=Vaginisenegalia massiliensis TaxID=2058294 RepID=UPI000F520BAF|nr:DHH family phosphoesterase [Vaginisenegalia massiliensis]